MAVKETRYDSVESLLRAKNDWDYSYDIHVAISGGVETIRAAKTVRVNTTKIRSFVPSEIKREVVRAQIKREVAPQIRRELSGKYYDEDGNSIK